MRSKPLTQKKPDIPRNKVSSENFPVRAISTAGGAIKYTNPRK